MEIEQIHADLHFKDMQQGYNMQHGQTALTRACSIQIQQGNAAWKYSMDRKFLYNAWKRSMEKFHGYS
jgi:hypothetical protein